MSNKLGNLLKDLRGPRSLRMIAEMTGYKISHCYLDALEKGKNPKTGKTPEVSHEKLKILAEAFGYSYESFLRDIGYLDEINADKLICYFDELPTIEKEIFLNKLITERLTK